MLPCCPPDHAPTLDQSAAGAAQAAVRNMCSALFASFTMLCSRLELLLPPLRDDIAVETAVGLHMTSRLLVSMWPAYRLHAVRQRISRLMRLLGHGSPLHVHKRVCCNGSRGFRPIQQYTHADGIFVHKLSSELPHSSKR